MGWFIVSGINHDSIRVSDKVGQKTYPMDNSNLKKDKKKNPNFFLKQ